MSVTLSHRPGYIFLVTVLVIGVIASATATSLLLLGWAAEQNGFLVYQSSRAYENAVICAERALREMRNDLSYAGNVTIPLSYGSCRIEAVGGSGNEHRTLCVTGYGGDTVRRIQANIRRLYPDVKVHSWQEVPSFTLCN